MNFRTVLSFVVALQLLALPLAANGCPYCRYSPNDWGFCRIGTSPGYYECTEYVKNYFTGQTGCRLCGRCDWSSPYGWVPCDPEAEDCGGGSVPCQQTRAQQRDGDDSCSTPSSRPVTNRIDWMGARNGQIAVF
jgi:hypothetical protein